VEPQSNRWRKYTWVLIISATAVTLLLHFGHGVAIDMVAMHLCMRRPEHALIAGGLLEASASWILTLDALPANHRAVRHAREVLNAPHDPLHDKPELSRRSCEADGKTVIDWLPEILPAPDVSIRGLY